MGGTDNEECWYKILMHSSGECLNRSFLVTNWSNPRMCQCVMFSVLIDFLKRAVSE